jgi:hypothetical protein
MQRVDGIGENALRSKIFLLCLVVWTASRYLCDNRASAEMTWLRRALCVGLIRSPKLDFEQAALGAQPK